MFRRLLIPVAVPAFIIGLLLCGTCLVSAWHINRLQRNMTNILSDHVASLQAAQELEIRVRQLRYHSFLYLIDLKPDRLPLIEADHRRFEAALEAARRSAHTPQEREYVRDIAAGYKQYRDELARLCADATPDRSLSDLIRLADAHPVLHIVDPCQELLRVNQEAMEETSRESAAVGQQARWIMLLVGIAGPLGGLLSGLGVARGLSRSFCRLSVRVQDIAQRLEQDVASVNLVADGDIAGLDQQLQHVLRRVEEVTQRMQQHQRDMLRAEQLASLGQLAASVAHEIRNPLTGIKLLVELALRPGAAKPLTPEDLRVIHAELARLERTTQTFLNFARLPAPCRAECDLRDLVGQVADLIHARAVQQQVEVAVCTPESPVCVSVDRDQFRTVLLNLCLNALDAMPHGGQLEVGLQTLGECEARLTITDSGAGIAPEMIARLFTPFASSKPAGTGLGLSISRRIVEEHGGRVTADNRPEGGARFTVLLPRVGVAIS